MKEKSCALTGHRDLPPDFPEDELLFALADLVEEGFTTFYCGMARGFDLTALKALAEIKKSRNIVIEACIPYGGQDKSMAQKDKELYQSLLLSCDRKTLLYPTFKPGCTLARDRYMVDRADVVFAYCKRDKGGSAYTVKYARSKGIEVRLFG